MLYFLVMGEKERKLNVPLVDGPQAEDNTGKAVATLQIIIILMLLLAVYFNAIFNSFVYDDTEQVLDNPWIKDVRHIPEIFSRSVWSFKKEILVSNYYRPMMYIIYMFNYHVFGLKPWGFHLVNILFHAGVSTLVFIIMKKLESGYAPSNGPALEPPGSWQLWRRKRTLLSPPFIASAVFAVHPIHTEAVAWVAGLPDLSFSFFFLLSFYLYLRSRDALGVAYVLSLGSFFIAVLCKETALVLPVIVLAYDLTFNKEGFRTSGRWKRYFAYLAVAGMYLIMRINALGGLAPLPAHAKLSVHGYIINVFPLFMQYLEKLVMPVNLNAFHVFHPIGSLFQLRGLLSVTVAAAFVLLVLIALKRKRVVFFCLLLVVVPLLPVLYIPGLGESAFAERYLYLPSLGFAFLSALLFSWGITNAPKRTPFLIVAFILVIGSYSAATASRNAVWNNDYVLFADTVRKSPDAASPRISLGNALCDNGRIDEAFEQYEAALKIEPDSPEAYNNIGDVCRERGWLDKAVGYYQIALALNPDSAGIHNNLGNAYYDKGWADKAVEQFQIALRLNPDYAQAHNNLGSVYYDKGLTDEAIEQYRIALRLNPDLAEAHNNLGNVFREKGWIDYALQEYQSALKLNPAYADAHYNLGNVYVRKGWIDKAVEEYLFALKQKPDLAEAHYNLANAYYEKGRTAEAREQYLMTISLKPGDAEAHYNLGVVYLRMGLQDEAKKEFDAAVKINPAFANTLGAP